MVFVFGMNMNASNFTVQMLHTPNYNGQAMNKLLRILLTLSILLFSGIDKVFSQEWRIVERIMLGEDLDGFQYLETLELLNGDVIVCSEFNHGNNTGEAVSRQSGLSLIYSDGEEISRNEYFKPWYQEMSRLYLFEKDEEIYFLTAYSPDHDINSVNYFKNSDNPPTEAIIGLYKLDSSLNIVESYEHPFPIDTFEDLENEYWSLYPNHLCGNINIYSAFEDNGIITGSYTKEVSYSEKPRGNDSVFFFKMDFDGNLLLNKGYETHESSLTCFRQQMVKNDNGYIVYYRNSESSYPDYHHSRVEYYDNNFNFIDTRYVNMPGHPPYNQNGFREHCIMRSNHNTTYVSTGSRSLTIPSRDDNVRLYEFDDNLDNSTEVLPVLRYSERETNEIDRTSSRGLDMTSKGDIFFAYTLNYGSMRQGDSWVIIEKLDSDFDTIYTLFYDDGEKIHTEVVSIQATSDDGLLLVTHSYYVGDICNRWSAVSKFPASAFDPDNIEEVHAHNLHLAVAYPNPGGDVMNIRTSLRNCTLQVYDMQGRMVHKQEITDDVTSVDASNWQRGTYVWELGTGNGNEYGSRILESGKWVK